MVGCICGAMLYGKEDVCGKFYGAKTRIWMLVVRIDIYL